MLVKIGTFVNSFLLALASIVICVFPSLGNDLDDGISKYTDDGISKYHELGKVDRNIKYIKMRAIGRAKMRGQSGENIASYGKGGTKQANMNSVIVGPGGKIKGDVIIIDDSKGEKNQIVE